YPGSSVGRQGAPQPRAEKQGLSLPEDPGRLDERWVSCPIATRQLPGAHCASSLGRSRQRSQEEGDSPSSGSCGAFPEPSPSLPHPPSRVLISCPLCPQERDGMRAILGSYDSELTPAEYSPQLTRRMREAEDMVQKVHSHSAEMEAQLSQALEELGGQKQRADMLEMELKMLKSQSSSAEQSCLFSREEVDTLRLKVEELEGERSQLEEEKRMLEAQLERRALQVRAGQPLGEALPGAECERLRGLLRAMERGGTVPADLEAAAASLPSSKEVAELKKQVESAELKNQRLKEVFQTKIQEFRKACYTLTGYQIDITTENQYRLTSLYAEHPGDCLIFKATSPSGSKMQLLETEFSHTVGELIEVHLRRQDSIPAFLSSLTLELFSRQTVA
uniref:Mitotic spindle assembly checkpoint protein MAD1 n=1 Tax=Nomascus leucogenys TaxID=61853 RepID=A0A2I3G335_NOMLE